MAHPSKKMQAWLEEEPEELSSWSGPCTTLPPASEPSRWESYTQKELFPVSIAEAPTGPVECARPWTQLLFPLQGKS